MHLLKSKFNLALPFESVLTISLTTISPSLSLMTISISASEIGVLFKSVNLTDKSFP